MQRAPPDDDEDEEAGAEDYEPCYLWPCNVATFNLWQRLQTQWRISSGMDSERRTGLDYHSVFTYLDNVARIKRKDTPEVWSCIQAMELAALNAWNEMRQQ